jgi:hypothetical protein
VRARSLVHVIAAVSIAALVLVVLLDPLAAADRKFYDDDPIAVEPDPQDASKVLPWDIDLIWDLSYNMFAKPGDSTPNVRARSINTIDEVPDSSWFTNRILARSVSDSEAARGPLTGDGPAPGRWSVIARKSAGAAPGFTVRDARDQVWFISFDGEGHPEAATGALLVANKIFWTLGYWQVENYLTTVRLDNLDIAESATFESRPGHKKVMDRGDLEDVLSQAHRSIDGSYRAVAARAIPGTPLGGFRYHGTRPDDPNDVVPHEHRRELRALKVFAAWVNLTDMKAGNTLDARVSENGRTFVRHYLQDVGSALGSGALGPHDPDEGWEYLFDGDKMMKRAVSVGFYLQPWQTARYEKHVAAGRFEGDAFDPPAWRPRTPSGAFVRARPDDTFWAARRVQAFSSEMIRAIVKSGAYSDPNAERYIADTLIKRRDKVAAAYLPTINPLVGFTLGEDGALAFENAAIKADTAAPPTGGYTARWATFDNATGATQPLGETSAPQTTLPAPPGLAKTTGTFVQVAVTGLDQRYPSWGAPVTVYFKRQPQTWKLVGVERLP